MTPEQFDMIGKVIGFLGMGCIHTGILIQVVQNVRTGLVRDINTFFAALIFIGVCLYQTYTVFFAWDWVYFVCNNIAICTDGFLLFTVIYYKWKLKKE